MNLGGDPETIQMNRIQVTYKTLAGCPPGHPTILQSN
jgi:hypothetical protein